MARLMNARQRIPCCCLFDIFIVVPAIQLKTRIAARYHIKPVSFHSLSKIVHIERQSCDDLVWLLVLVSSIDFGLLSCTASTACLYRDVPTGAKKTNMPARILTVVQSRRCLGNGSTKSVKVSAHSRSNVGPAKRHMYVKRNFFNLFVVLISGTES